MYLAIAKVYVRRSEQFLMCLTNLCICIFYSTVLIFELNLFPQADVDSVLKASFYICTYSALGLHVVYMLYHLGKVSMLIYSAKDGLVMDL